MDGHHPHGIVVVLGQDRVGHPALGGLQDGPLQIAAYAVTPRIGPRPCLLDDVAQAAPHVARVGACERKVEEPALVGDCGEQVGRRRGAHSLGHRANMGDRVGDGMVTEPRRRCRPQIPVAAAGLPLPQLDVAAAVERAAERLDQSQGVGGVVGGA